MLNETANGVYTIAVTPFLPDGALDFDSIDTMVDAYIERGATGLTVLGMMGEAGKGEFTPTKKVGDKEEF